MQQKIRSTHIGSLLTEAGAEPEIERFIKKKRQQLIDFIHLPVIARMLTTKDGALLKDIIEIEHNYSLTSNSD